MPWRAYRARKIIKTAVELSSNSYYSLICMYYQRSTA